MSFRVAVVGCGRMGKHHARTFHQLESADLVCVVDANAKAAESLARQRDCDALTDPAQAVERVDAAVIATPTVAHLDAARPFVQAGKGVLIEKPFCNDPLAGQALIDLAETTGAVVLTGHTERFNPASVALSTYAVKPKFIEAHRISPYTFRSADVGVVLDMMIHDIDLVLSYARSDVADIQAVGVAVVGATEDICNARLSFANGCVANITASRLAIKTERKMRIFSEEHYLSVDYGKKVGIVIEKGKNLDLIQMARDMDVDDIAELAQSVDYTDLLTIEELSIDESQGDPLTLQARDFQAAVQAGKSPTVPASDGLAAVRTANAIVEKLNQHRWDGEVSERSGPHIIDPS
jgi:predicted dehydrogenase